MRHRRRFKPKTTGKRYRVNRGIRSPQLRVVDDEGEPLGIISLDQALRVAREKELDLVEVAPNSNPPVAKIMDYGKFKYSMEKRSREARKKSKTSSLKEVKLRTKIGDHDFNTKKNHAIGFFRDGHKVKVTMAYFGREMAHVDMGREVLVKMIKELSEFGKVEMPPKMEGRNMSAIMVGKAGMVVHREDEPKISKQRQKIARNLAAAGSDPDASELVDDETDLLDAEFDENDESNDDAEYGDDESEYGDDESDDDESNDDESNDDESNDDESDDDESNDDESNDDESNDDESNDDESNDDESNDDDPDGSDDSGSEGSESDKQELDQDVP